ncbi:cell division topological determinant MinJ [Clostridium acetireducens DSM 10703]|jgi:hypothetical protein|uniref:Cell division topological determinant MinJ n=1 Tax=Clostridium acetireducens DSM 10703 TaxID=1121290 RepID=A0A1E8F1L2_9CLOT|nr:PDZ domain-containing protein [Clostridium acetireducens]OFI07500.1 cell division topological determinant MinJ [Clostridium acetireducens DSM 10703]
MNIFKYTLKSIAFALTHPYFLLILSIIFIILYKKNKRIAAIQGMIMGYKKNLSLELTMSEIVIGIFAGTLGSILLSYLGITFSENSGIDLVFLASIIFMLWRPRFMCFSYSASIVGLISLFLIQLAQVLKIPNFNALNIDIPALMTLVAVLHFIEGILVILDGKRGAIPVFSKRGDKIIGGFAMERYWVLPITLFIILSDKSILQFTSEVPMPQWWPILKTSIPNNMLQNAILTLIPFYGVVGYKGITFTKTKEEKNLSTGVFLIAYSIIIFLLAQLANLNIYLKILVLLVAPLMHEYMMRFEINREVTDKPKYVSDSDGIMVLDVAPDSPAMEMGVKSGDLLIEINNNKIENEEDIFNIIRAGVNFIWFKVKRDNGNIVELNYNSMNSTKNMGIIFVPKALAKDDLTVHIADKKIMEFIKRIKQKDHKNN